MIKIIRLTIAIKETIIERERERVQMDVAQLVRLPNGNQEFMGSTPTFHNGIY